MTLIKTKSFELAVNTKGDQNSVKLAIMLPGRLDTKDYINFLRHMDYLSKRGFYAIVIDPPGTWESPGDISLYSTTNYIKAVNELIEYFGNKPTLLLGHSRGGTVAINVGAKNPNVIGIISIMATYGKANPPSKEAIKAGVDMSSRDLPPGDKRPTKQRIFPLPISYFDDSKRYDTLKELMECRIPKLLFYGDEDSFSTPQEVKEIFKQIPEPKMIHELKTKHDYRLFPEAIEEVNKVLGEFLDKYNL